MEELKISSRNSSPPGEDSCLLLEVAEKIIPKSESVLDLGTGSGFLAIALSKRGWSKVSGSDIDKRALLEARENARRNSVEVEFHYSDLFSSAPPADWVLFNPPLLGKPAGRLASIRRIPGISVLSGALASVFRGRLAEILRKFVSGIPNKSKALVVLPRAFYFKKGLLVGKSSRYSAYLVGKGIAPPPAPPKKFKKRLPWE